MFTKESPRHTRFSALVFTVILLALTHGCPAMAANIFVPGDYPTIQEGIDAAADGDVVVLYDGTYTGDGNKNLVFNGKAITVRSKDGADGCVIDCEGSGRGFIFLYNEPPEATVMELTIVNGMSPVSGAGILVNIGSPTITGCVIQDCDSGVYGGGIACFPGTAPEITGNVIENCQADGYGGGISCINSNGTISGNLIGGNEAYYGGGISCDVDAKPLITDNVFSGNLAYGNGGGVYCTDGANAEIRENTIEGNEAENGGGVFFAICSPTLHSNSITSNEATDGGGLFMIISYASVVENSFTNNRADFMGGGIHSFFWTAPEISYNTITANSADAGGGICCFNTCSPQIVNNLVQANNAQYGGGIYCEANAVPLIRNCTVTGNSASCDSGGMRCNQGSQVTVGNSIFWDNSAPIYDELYCDGTSTLTVCYSDVEGGYTGTDNIDLDPRFTGGPLGDFYLSALAAGQFWDSACIDAGDPDSEMIQGTTRSDQTLDSGVVDMGYHYPVGLIVNGPGPAAGNPPLVRTFPGGGCEPSVEFEAFIDPHYGVNLVCGDVDGDFRDEIIAGAGHGPWLPASVRGFEADGTAMPGLDFSAFNTGTYGVCVAVGDLDGDGLEEIVTGRGPAPIAAPQVRAFSYKPGIGVTPVANVRFTAYATLGRGVNVACGDVDGDGRDEIVTGAGPGATFSPHVRGWNVDGGMARPIPRLSFSAYSLNEYGVVVTCGDLDGDGRDEIITAPGPGSTNPARIRAWTWSRRGVKPVAGVDFLAFTAAEAAGGARVACTDLDGDGCDELIVSGGPDAASGPSVRVFSCSATGVTQVDEYDAFPTGWTHGVSVAGGHF